MKNQFKKFNNVNVNMQKAEGERRVSQMFGLVTGGPRNFSNRGKFVTSLPLPSPQQVNASLIHMVGIQRDLSSIEICAEIYV